MSLLQLPAEILLHIFDDVGSAYFRSDLARLTVCKLWSEFAYTACFKDCSIEADTTLRSLVSSSPTSQRLFQNNVKSLELRLRCYEQGDVWVWGCTEWSTETDVNLAYLAKIIKRSTKLSHVLIEGNPVFCPEFALRYRKPYLSEATMRSVLLAAINLSTLDLDLYGCQQSRREVAKIHFCGTIARLLPKLRRLRLRMWNMCTDALTVPDRGTDNHGRNLPLQEVLVSLSQARQAEFGTIAWYAALCNTASHSGHSLVLQEVMEKQAQVLAAQMTNPKMVRVLTHVFPPTPERRAFDAVTGKIIKLGEHAAWDAEGEILEDEEEVSDTESEISDLSSNDSNYSAEDVGYTTS